MNLNIDSIENIIDFKTEHFSNEKAIHDFQKENSDLEKGTYFTFDRKRVQNEFGILCGTHNLFINEALASLPHIPMIVFAFKKSHCHGAL